MVMWLADSWSRKGIVQIAYTIGITVIRTERSAAMYVYGIKHDPMVHGMYRQHATTNPRGKEKRKKTTSKKMYK